MNNQSESYRFKPGEEQEMDKLVEDYTIQGWKVNKIKATDGSGDTIVILTPPT